MIILKIEDGLLIELVLVVRRRAKDASMCGL